MYTRFHPNPILNDGAIGFLEERRLNNKNNNNKMNSDTGSVPDPEMHLRQVKQTPTTDKRFIIFTKCICPEVESNDNSVY